MPNENRRKPDKAERVARELVRSRRNGMYYDLVVVGRIESSWAKKVPDNVIEQEVNRVAALLRKAGIHAK